MYCPNCGIEIGDGFKFCGKCGFQLEGVQNNSDHSSPGISYVMNRKSEGISLILAIILPGLAHIYLEKLTTGLLFIFASILVMTLSITLMLEGMLGVGLLCQLVCFGIWIYSIVDSNSLTKKYNARLLQE